VSIIVCVYTCYDIEMYLKYKPSPRRMMYHTHMMLDGSPESGMSACNAATRMVSIKAATMPMFVNWDSMRGFICTPVGGYVCVYG
jgi:hypothetical protein